MSSIFTPSRAFSVILSSPLTRHPSFLLAPPSPQLKKGTGTTTKKV
jgi:hypothetical protein